MDGFTEGGSEHLGSPNAWFEVGMYDPQKKLCLFCSSLPLISFFLNSLQYICFVLGSLGSIYCMDGLQYIICLSTYVLCSCNFLLQIF